MPFALKKQNADLDMAGPDAMESQTAGKAQTLTRGASSYAEGQRALSPDRNQIQSAPVQMEKDGSNPEVDADVTAAPDVDADATTDEEASTPSTKPRPTMSKRADPAPQQS